MQSSPTGSQSLRYLLDTNIILYPHDASDPARQARAIEVLRRVGVGPSAALPAQALAEFVNVARRKFSPPLDFDTIYRQVSGLARVFPVFPLTPVVILEATRGARDYQFAYYDAQIWAIAFLHQIPVVLSEDFNTGAVVKGVEFRNPFADTFDLATLS